MKKLFIFILSVSLLTGCKKSTHENTTSTASIPTSTSNPTVVSSPVVVTTNTLTNNSRKILIEDFTGHQCINSPRSAESANAVISANPGQVIVIANHVTNTFASPYNDSLYKEEFRNTASSAWDVTFGVSTSGLPRGLVNRVGGSQSYSSWLTLATPALAKPWSAKLDMTSYYDTVSHNINVKVKTTFITAWPNSVNLVVLFTQDSIISDQKDGAPPAGSLMDPNIPTRRLNYHFNNIALGSYNPDGALVKAGPIAINDTVTKLYQSFTLNQVFFNKPSLPIVKVKDKYVNAVAFVYDVTTKEILQVEKMRIK